jgi:hypothetical protein
MQNTMWIPSLACWCATSAPPKARLAGWGCFTPMVPRPRESTKQLAGQDKHKSHDLSPVPPTTLTFHVLFLVRFLPSPTLARTLQNIVHHLHFPRKHQLTCLPSSYSPEQAPIRQNVRQVNCRCRAPRQLRRCADVQSLWNQYHL